MPAYRSSTLTAALAAASPQVVTPPAGIANGDILELHFYIEDNSTPVSPPAGFTLKDTITTGVPSGNTLRHLVYWKRASGESGNYNITWTGGGSPFHQALMNCFSGCIAAGDPYSDTSGGFSTSAVNPPNITLDPIHDGCLISYVVTHWTSANGAGYSGGGLTWTERDDTASDIHSATAPQTTAASVTISSTTTGAADAITAWAGALRALALESVAVKASLKYFPKFRLRTAA